MELVHQQSLCSFYVLLHMDYEANISKEEDKSFTSSLNNCHLHMWIQFPLNKRKGIGLKGS